MSRENSTQHIRVLTKHGEYRDVFRAQAVKTVHFGCTACVFCAMMTKKRCRTEVRRKGDKYALYDDIGRKESQL